MRATLILALLAAAAACTPEPPKPETAPTVEPETGAPNLTTEQQAAYDQCLRDNQAVAVAWEMIERQCLEQVLGTAPKLE